MHSLHIGVGRIAQTKRERFLHFVRVLLELKILHLFLLICGKSLSRTHFIRSEWGISRRQLRSDAQSFSTSLIEN